MLANESQQRLAKAFQLLGHVVDITPTHATVISNGNKYRVNHVTGECLCKDATCRNIKCKHLYAVLIKTGKMKVAKI